MEAPQRVTYRQRLDAALEEARRLGRVGEPDYESLLVDPDFEELEFQRFRRRVLASGLELPEPAADAEPAPDEAPALGEPGRDLLDLYLDEIGRIPLLPHEELLALARRSRAGDPDARRRIILANLRLVVHLARRYHGRGLQMLDLIEEGNLGLIHAVDRFEPERGLRFSTYAAIWIRQAVLRGLAEQARSLRIPVQMFQQASRYVRAERLLRHRLGRDPGLEELAHELRVSLERAGRLSALIAGLRSLDEGSSLAAIEELSAEYLGGPPPSVERLVELQLEHASVDRLLRSLSQREEQILRIRYGFHDGVARTLAQTGVHFGITRERVRQIEARALEKLRRALELDDVERPAGTAAP